MPEIEALISAAPTLIAGGYGLRPVKKVPPKMKEGQPA